VNPLPIDFYRKKDVVGISRKLLGKALFTSFRGSVTGGLIIETEAYAGPEDKASHAYGNRRTKRTEVMFAAGGVAYVYLCYGMHALFNVVVNQEGVPHGVLIRALMPTHGIKEMVKRRGVDLPSQLCSGPGKLTSALGISVAYSGHCLNRSPIWIEDVGYKVAPKSIITGPRVGIDYAQEWVDRPWRFQIEPPS
jgi:DNA-3-methyladenine glycosylase